MLLSTDTFSKTAEKIATQKGSINGFGSPNKMIIALVLSDSLKIMTVL